MRYYGLDFARAVFMIIGIFFHAGIIYQYNGTAIVQSQHTDILFNYITPIPTYFRMSGFFLISGFFLAMHVEKYGPKKSFHNRLLKLGVPLLFCGIFINPFINMISYERPVGEDVLQYVFQGRWLLHLWFLGNLLIYSCAYTVLSDCIAQKSKKIPAKYFTFLMLFPVASFCALFSQMLLRKISYVLGLNDIDVIIFFMPYKLVYYFPYFLLGCVFFHNNRFFTYVTTPRRVFPIFLLSLLTVVISLMFNLEDSFSQLSNAIKALYSVTVTVLIIGVFNMFKTDSKIIKKISDSSYTIYLLHLPIIVVLFYPIESLGWGSFSSYILICSLTLLITFSIHQFIVKRYKIAGFLLNGTTYSNKDDK